MAKRPRTAYTDKQREEILSAALKDGLTALQIQKKYGVKPVTYYSWRKKKGIKGPRGRKPAISALAASSGDISTQVRAGVQARVRVILPSIVREEVGRYLDSLFGSTGAPRRARKAAK